MLSKRLSAFCAVALGCAPLLSLAANFDVNNPTEFQTALTTAQANNQDDTINVAAGTFDVSTNGTLTYTAVASENFALTIAGNSMADTVLDGGAAVQILRLDSTAVTDDNAVIFRVQDIIFQNGNALDDNGGALTILTNEDQQPAVFPQLVDVSGCEFHNSTATADGGALFVRAHALDGIWVVNTDFVDNQAGGHGGGAFIAGGLFTTPITFDFIDFYNNTAQGSGGGLAVRGFDSATPSSDLANDAYFRDVAFYNNDSATGGGGGADVSALTTGFDSVGFIDNTGPEGGGLRVGPNWSSVRVVNSGFVGNSAIDGGAIALRESFFNELALTNNTIYQNGALNNGGGAYILIDGSSSIATIYNNIIYDNGAQGGTGDDLFINNRFFDDIGAPVELFHNDITDYDIGPVAPSGVATNIDAAPMLVDMAARPLPDPRLQPGSPAIDAGFNDAPGIPFADFDGNFRILDGDGDTVAIVDIGMDEFGGELSQNADLGVTNLDVPDPVTEGEDITYNIFVHNYGPGAATDVTLTDTIDELVTYVSATPSQGTCSVNLRVVTCAIGSLASGATANVTLIVTAGDVDEPTQISNLASVSGTELDPVGSNDNWMEATTIVPVGPAMADLAVAKSDTPDPVLSGGPQLTYSITVTNNGPDDATNVLLVDTLPAEVTFDTATPSAGDCDPVATLGEVECRLGNLASGNNMTVTVVVTPDTVEEATSITNTVTVSAAEEDPNLENNTASASSTVNPPGADMSVSISSSSGTPMAGDTVTFNMTVTNNGPSDDSGVVATLAVTEDGEPTLRYFLGAAFESLFIIDQGTCGVLMGDITLVCTIGDMDAGATVSGTLEFTAPSRPVTIALTATVTGDVSDAVTDNNSDSGDVAVIDVVDLVIQGTSEGSGSVGWPTLLLLITAATLAAFRNREYRTYTRAIGLIGIISIGLMLPVGEVQAQNDWYLGASIGDVDLDYDAGNLQQDLANLGWTISNASVDSSGTAWKAYGGFALNKFVAFEIGYAYLGEVVTQYSTTISPNDVDEILSDTYSVHPYQGDGWFGAVVLRWPVNPDVITLHARAGAFSWNSDIDVRVISGGTGSVTGDDSGTDMMYGFGGEWHINPAWSLVIEWERYEMNEWLDVPSIGVKFSF